MCAFLRQTKWQTWGFKGKLSFQLLTSNIRLILHNTDPFKAAAENCWVDKSAYLPNGSLHHLYSLMVHVPYNGVIRFLRRGDKKKKIFLTSFKYSRIPFFTNMRYMYKGVSCKNGKICRIVEIAVNSDFQEFFSYILLFHHRFFFTLCTLFSFSTKQFPFFVCTNLMCP